MFILYFMNLNNIIMRNKLFIYLFFAGITMMAAACSPNPTPKVSDSDERTTQTSEEETIYANNGSNVKEEIEELEKEDVVENATKRDKLFYQRLLEYFCYHHYTDCFGSSYSPRIYKENSLVVDGEPTVVDCNMDGDRIVSYNVNVSGKNSWEGYLNTKHNDWPFNATIYELGNDQYRITFNTPEVKRWPAKGPSKKILSATRTIEYIDSE